MKGKNFIRTDIFVSLGMIAFFVIFLFWGKTIMQLLYWPIAIIIGILAVGSVSSAVQNYRNTKNNIIDFEAERRKRQ